MLDLEKLGLVELNAQEQVEIEGGGIVGVILIIALLLYATNAY